MMYHATPCRTFRNPDELLLELRTCRMHYLEQAAMLHALHTRHGYTLGELSRQTGWPPQMVADRVRLMTLDEGLRASLMTEGAPERIALVLTRLTDEVTRRRIARQICRERLCIRDAALLVEAALRRRERMPRALPVRHGMGRVISLVRDHRPYINAIRDIAGQMQAAGVRTTFTEKRAGSQLEVTVALSVRHRRTERRQSM